MLSAVNDVYLDPDAAVDDRVDDLVGRMTLEEKVAQLGGVWVTDLVGPDGVDEGRARSRLQRRHRPRDPDRGVDRRCVPSESARVFNEIQRIAIDANRLGIPVVVHEESVGGLCARGATVFPQAIGLAATWDPDLIESVAGVIREQMMAVGARHTLAPVLDIARDPRWGRVEETYGEDPVLERRARHRLRPRPADERPARRRDLHRQALPRLRPARGRHEPRARAARAARAARGVRRAVRGGDP